MKSMAGLWPAKQGNRSSSPGRGGDCSLSSTALISALFFLLSLNLLSIVTDVSFRGCYVHLVPKLELGKMYLHALIRRHSLVLT